MATYSFSPKWRYCRQGVHLQAGMGAVACFARLSYPLPLQYRNLMQPDFLFAYTAD